MLMWAVLSLGYPTAVWLSRKGAEVLTDTAPTKREGLREFFTKINSNHYDTPPLFIKKINLKHKNTNTIWQK